MGETRMKKGRLTVQAITMVLTQTRAIIQRCFPGQCGVTVSWVLRLCVGQSHHRSGGFPATGGPSPLFPANNISLEPLEQLCTHLNPISAVSRCRCRTICPLCSLIAVPSGHIHQYHCDCHIWVNTWYRVFTFFCWINKMASRGFSVHYSEHWLDFSHVNWQSLQQTCTL